PRDRADADERRAGLRAWQYPAAGGRFRRGIQGQSSERSATAGSTGARFAALIPLPPLPCRSRSTEISASGAGPIERLLQAQVAIINIIEEPQRAPFVDRGRQIDEVNRGRLRQVMDGRIRSTHHPLDVSFPSRILLQEISREICRPLDAAAARSEERR